MYVFAHQSPLCAYTCLCILYVDSSVTLCWFWELNIRKKTSQNTNSGLWWYSFAPYMQDIFCQDATYLCWYALHYVTYVDLQTWFQSHVTIIILHVNIIILHVDIIMLHANIIILHVDLNKSHVNMIILHVEIIYLACRRQKYATILDRERILITIYHVYIEKFR